MDTWLWGLPMLSLYYKLCTTTHHCTDAVMLCQILSINQYLVNHHYVFDGSLLRINPTGD